MAQPGSGVSRPFRRTWRPGSSSAFIEHEKYAVSPRRFVRGAQLLEKDLLQLFEYIEPAEANLKCFSMRTHELLVRACVEVEANLKAIMRENEYSRAGRWNMGLDYWRVEVSHHLSSYQIKLPDWHEGGGVRRPFEAWETMRCEPKPQATPGHRWYQAYNRAKHDRASAFAEAEFGHAIDAVCACMALICAQFRDEDFSGRTASLVLEGGDEFDTTVGQYLRVGYPDDFSEDERYAFAWDAIREDEEPFRPFDFSKT